MNISIRLAPAFLDWFSLYIADMVIFKGTAMPVLYLVVPPPSWVCGRFRFSLFSEGHLVVEFNGFRNIERFHNDSGRIAQYVCM